MAILKGVTFTSPAFTSEPRYADAAGVCRAEGRGQWGIPAAFEVPPTTVPIGCSHSLPVLSSEGVERHAHKEFLPQLWGECAAFLHLILP